MEIENKNHYFNAAGPQSQGEQPRPVSGQSTGCQPVSGQHTACQYSYNGQTAGPGQNQAGGRTGGGKNHKLLIPIGIGAAAAAVLVMVIIEIAALTPSAPPQALGTVDGFFYEIIDRDHAVLTGCEAGADFTYIPDRVDDVPVTGIADGAFAGMNTGNFVNLPLHLETIGANAFLGCTDLSYVSAYSDVAAESSSFNGCDNLWYVSVRSYDNVSGWRLPSGVSLYYYGMETGAGTLNGVTRSGGILTGETDSGHTVLLDVMPGTGYVAGLDDVDWICSRALDNLGYGAAVELGESTLYPYEVFSDSIRWSAPEDSLADMWLLSCEAAEAINAARPSGTVRIEPDMDLLAPALVRASELATVNDSTRPDGRNGFTALDDAGVDYGYAGAVRGYDCYSRSAVSEDMSGLVDHYAVPLTKADDPGYAGEYYSWIGAAYSETAAGEYVYYVFVTIS